MKQVRVKYWMPVQVEKTIELTDSELKELNALVDSESTDENDMIDEFYYADNEELFEKFKLNDTINVLDCDQLANSIEILEVSDTPKGEGDLSSN